MRKEEWKMALKYYDRGIKQLQEVNLANRACIACRESLVIGLDNT